MTRKPTRTVRGLSRRDLLKIAQVAGVGATAGSLTLVTLLGRRSHAESRAGTCRICTMHCGIIATCEGDRLVRIEGDPGSRTRGFICHHAQALPDIVHAHDRLTRPLERRGDTFVPVSWSQALAGIAEKMNRIKARHGARAIAVQTGWPFVRHPLIGILHRFCQAFGTPNLATVASLCEASDRMGKALTVGSNYVPDFAKTRTLAVWGANPTFTSPPFAHQVAQMALGGRNLIVIDPIKTELARAATIHLQVRPGTDGALALGMMNVIVREGLHDRAFIAAKTVGFDELTKLIERYPVERAAELSGVAAEDIRRAARLFATQGPSSVWDGLGVEHHANGVQTIRAISTIEALCGFLDARTLLRRPGPKLAGEPLPILYRMATPEPVPPPVADKPIGYDEFPLYEIFNRQAQANLFANAILDDKPYPLRGLILIGSNALVTSPASARLLKAAEKLDLLVSVDPFLNASGERADYVLPASTFMESPDVDADDEEVAPHGLAPEQASSWPDWKIVFELARALDLGRYFPWTSFHAAMKAHHVPYMRDEAHTIRAHEDAPAEFPTPSGKIELYSETLARFAQDPLPDFRPPAALTAEFPLRLVTGPRTRPFINSQFRTVAPIVWKMPEPYAEIHPRVATAAGLADGARVWIVSPHGRLEMTVRISDRVHPESVVVPAGWARANANQLTPADALDPISGFPTFRSLTCRIERV